MCVYVCVCMRVHVSVYVSVCVSMCVSVCVCRYVSLIASLPICQCFLSPTVCLYVFLSFTQSLIHGVTTAVIPNSPKSHV